MVVASAGLVANPAPAATRRRTGRPSRNPRTRCGTRSGRTGRRSARPAHRPPPASRQALPWPARPPRDASQSTHLPMVTRWPPASAHQDPVIYGWSTNGTRVRKTVESTQHRPTILNDESTGQGDLPLTAHRAKPPPDRFPKPCVAGSSPLGAPQGRWSGPGAGAGSGPPVASGQRSVSTSGVQAVGDRVQFVGEQVAVAVQGHLRRGVTQH